MKEQVIVPIKKEEKIPEQVIIENSSKPEENKKEEKASPEMIEKKEDKEEDKKNDLSTLKTLTLEIMESPSIKAGTIITINSEGLIGSKRGVKDGCAYFGTYTGDDQYQINDYTFSMEEQGFGKRHFMIEYDSTKNAYFLKDLGDGTGTFIKIINKALLNMNMIVSFNSIHLAILFPFEQQKAGTEIVGNDPLKDTSKDLMKDFNSYLLK